MLVQKSFGHALLQALTARCGRAHHYFHVCIKGICGQGGEKEEAERRFVRVLAQLRVWKDGAGFDIKWKVAEVESSALKKCVCSGCKKPSVSPSSSSSPAGSEERKRVAAGGEGGKAPSSARKRARKRVEAQCDDDSDDSDEDAFGSVPARWRDGIKALLDPKACSGMQLDTCICGMAPYKQTARDWRDRAYMSADNVDGRNRVEVCLIMPPFFVDRAYMSADKGSGVHACTTF